MRKNLLPLMLSLALPAAARAANEAHVYGIANFGGSGQCGDMSMTHSVHTSTAAAFRGTFDYLKSLLLWDVTQTRNNGSARGSYFTDASKAGSCSCTADDATSGFGADAADVIYVHTHGSHDTAGVGWSRLSMGNSSYDCRVQTDQNMLWNSDLDMAVLIKACQSGDYDVFKDGGYRAQFTTSGSTMSLWNAFHGDSSCGDHVTDYVGDYSGSSIYDGAGENWIDAAFAENFWDDDDCPTSIVMGSSKSARTLEYEHGGWLDRKNTGSKTASTMWYVAGCEPSNGRVLPN